MRTPLSAILLVVKPVEQVTQLSQVVCLICTRAYTIADKEYKKYFTSGVKNIISPTVYVPTYSPLWLMHAG